MVVTLSDIINLFSLEHLEKAPSLIEFKSQLDDISILSKFEQRLKALLLIIFNFFGMVILFNLEQTLNACLPIVSNSEVGFKFTTLKLLHWKKASWPIVLILSEKVTVDKLDALEAN